jgi:hypothetical protein
MSDKSDINNLKNKLKKLQTSVGQGGSIDTVARARLEEVSSLNNTLKNNQDLLNESVNKIKNGDFISAGATGLKNILDSKPSIESVYTKIQADSNFINTQQVNSVIENHPSVLSKANSSEVSIALNNKADTSVVNTSLSLKADSLVVNTALDAKAEKSSVYTITQANTKFRTAEQVTTDIQNHNFEANPNSSLISKLSAKADTLNVYDKSAADSLFRTAKQVSDDIVSHPAVTEKAKIENVYTKADADKTFTTTIQVGSAISSHPAVTSKAEKSIVYTITEANDKFRTAEQINTDISNHPAVTAKADVLTVNTALSLKADTSTVYSKISADSKFRTATQVTSDIANHDFTANANITLNNKLLTKADTANVYDKSSADLKFTTPDQVGTAITIHPSVISRAEKASVYSIDESNNKFRTASQVTNDITNHDFSANSNISLNNKLSAKADSTSIYDKTAADSKFRTATQVTTDIINHDFTANPNVTLNTKLSVKADSTSIYNKSDADAKFRTAAQVSTDIASHPTVLLKADSISVYNKTDADNKFRTTAQVASDIGVFDFSSANSSLTTRIKNHDFSTNSNTTLESKFSSRDTRLNSLDVHTSSINIFSSSHGYKLANFAFSTTEESTYRYAAYSKALKVLFDTPPYDPTSGYDVNKWYYTSLLPVGNADFKFSSYSYQGYGKAGLLSPTQENYNKEEFIAYRKRLYNVVNNAYTSNIYQDSQLRLQAAQTIITNGTTDNKNPTLVVKGETNNSNAYNTNDQGQIFIQDEDSSTSGLMIGYVYNAGVNEYARLQATNISAPTSLYLQPAGGKVFVGSSRAIENLNVQEGIAVTNGDVNTYLYNWQGDKSNAGAIQVKAGASNSNLNGTSDYWFYINPSGGSIRLGSIGGASADVVPGQSNTIRLGTSGLAWKEIWTNAGVLNSSDERIKTDIKDSEFGLQFINKLRPVSYKLKSKERNTKIGEDGKQILEDVPGIRPHYGFLAQQVKEAMGDKDFAGYIYDSETDVYALRYTEFISPMVKAIQELSEENDYLKNKLQEKDKQLADILVRLAALEGK